ncbi:Trp biosynthesis-associated membrane protein [Actinophytocola sp. S1-96]|uniref:Trp biosynthesis-associated membrane protein n=2 Tax=Actinophytocola gossypii TaxID=2812003 RepID=A0ABT2JCM9_9PSEU|nr:Trp biosynthesis-associated membrane protein [Actinophytocola gossypii]
MVLLPLLGAAAALWGSTRLDGGPGSGTGLALVALAGAGGAIAVGGWGRRVVGALVAVAGLLAGWRALAADGAGAGRWVALLGAVLLVVAGVLVVRLATRLPTMGARYASPAARRASGDPDGDPDKDLWDGLSEGRDPTAAEVEDER